ncbi:MAG: hypothetical protein J0M04_11580 [Verrucomicrobia bacterium]|nr:hypothetical protein [Verrucomicrobiota bacterium]
MRLRKSARGDLRGSSAYPECKGIKPI